jgi:asparagine synthase (glutamine-hydrolysing)
VNTNGLINYITNLNTNVTGSLFIDKKRVQGTQLSDYVSKWSWDTKDLINNLKNSNGFFSLIRYENGKLFAAVDRCRSMPLFYGFKDNDFFISDSPQWIRKKVQNNQIDKISKEALLLSGYVTEGNTLYQNVKQIQAGKCYM